MRIRTRLALASVFVTLLMGGFGLWMFLRVSGKLTEQQDSINQRRELSEAALNFNVENFHTQLEIWEYAYAPGEKRLDAFYAHQAVFDELFTTLLDTADAIELSPEDLQTITYLQSKIEQMKRTWIDVIAASERAASGTLEESSEGPDGYPFLTYPMFDPASVDPRDPGVRAAILRSEDVFDRAEFNRRIDDFVVSQSAALNLQVEKMSELKRSLTIQFLTAFAVVLGLAAVAIGRDGKKQEALETRLHRQAFSDKLTGLPNRAALLEILDRAAVSRVPSDRLTAVLFIDIDNFKVVNDSLGHAAGDELLKSVSDRITGSLRAGDVLGRLGGDEFLVVCGGVRSVEEAVAIGDRIVRTMGPTFVLGERSIHASVSVGVALMQPDESADEVLAAADAAVYEAKDHGRDRAVLFDAKLRQRARDQLEVGNSLKEALHRGGELVAYYQPIVDLAQGEVVAFEALCRWQHPEQGLLEASSFIQTAEQYGLEVPLSWLILEDVTAQIARWIADPSVENVARVGVNVSARQLRDPEFATRVRACLDTTGIPPALLCLEVTEQTMVADLDGTAEVLQELRELGVKVAIDDFGTGHSSLSYIRSLPIDVVKLDMSFTRAINDGPDAAAIVAAVIRMSNALGYCVVAEGIETVEHMATLQALRCDRGQGYLFSAAVPCDAATQLLTGQRQLDSLATQP